MVKTLIIILLIVIVIIKDHFGARKSIKDDKGKRLSIDNAKKQQRVQTVKGFIYPITGSEIDAIASYGNGTVYFGNTDHKYGSYDKDGNIFNQHGTKIGFVHENLCFMDRTSEYNRLLNQFPNSEYHEESYKPILYEPAATFYGSWIEPFTTSKYKGTDVYVSKLSENDTDNNRGACAAYIVATWDGVINDEQHKFYYCVQDDMHKIMKAKKGR